MISNKVKKLFNASSMTSNPELLKTLQDIQNLNDDLDILVFDQPDQFKIGYLTTYNLEKVKKISNGLPREFINFNLFENLYFITFTQIKQLLELYQSLLKDEKYYSSVIVLRSDVDNAPPRFYCNAYII